MKAVDTTPRCRLCHRPLATPESVALGIGPTCVQRERQTDLFDEARGKYLPKTKKTKTPESLLLETAGTLTADELAEGRAQNERLHTLIDKGKKLAHD